MTAEPKEDEEQLIERAKAGDQGAQNELFSRHMPGLHAWIRLKASSLVKERESSMDIVQSVFRQVLGELEKFEYRGPNGFRNWLLTYAQNTLRNRLHHWNSDRRSPDRETHESLSRFYGSIATPSGCANAKEQIERFELAFSKLSPHDQQIIVHASIEGLSHADIATRMGISEAASKKALQRARVRLSGHMTPHQEEG